MGGASPHCTRFTSTANKDVSPWLRSPVLVGSASKKDAGHYSFLRGRASPPVKQGAIKRAARSWHMRIRWRLSPLQLIRPNAGPAMRSEEHTSELQSRGHLVCRLLLEKKNKRQLII